MPAGDRVLLALTYGFSVRYVLPTGLLERLRGVCTPVVGLGWDDPELADVLAGVGVEVVRLPDAELSAGHRRLRQRLMVLHQRRLASPTTPIERRYREQLYGPRARLLAPLRRARDRAQVLRPGGAEALEASEASAARSGTNVGAFTDLLRRERVALAVCLTPYHDQDGLLLLAARDAGVPSLTSVISFDNPTARARMPVRSERVLVWNELNASELLRSYPDLTPDRVRVVGAPQFDLHHRPDLVVDEATWRRRTGLPADRPVVLYGAGPSFLVPHEERLVRLLDRAIDDGRLPGRPHLLVRRHPSEPPEVWRALGRELRHGTVVDPWAPGSTPFRGWPTHDDLVDQISSLAHAAVHVNVSSSMTLDGAVFDRPQVGPRFVPGLARRDARQVRQLYDREHWWPVTRSGGLATADDEAGLVAAVAEGLTDPGARRAGRQRLVRRLLTFTDGRSSQRMVDEVASLLGSRSGG